MATVKEEKSVDSKDTVVKQTPEKIALGQPSNPANGSNKGEQGPGGHKMEDRGRGRGNFRGGRGSGRFERGGRGSGGYDRGNRGGGHDRVGRGGFDRGNRSSRGGRGNAQHVSSQFGNSVEYPQDHEQSPVADDKPKEPKKFTGRCRLFVGNFTSDFDEDEMSKLFKEFGDVSEAYCNREKGFGFIRLDTRAHAEAAKASLDGTMRKGRMLRVRFAAHTAAIKVKHLPSSVSNELLEEAFSRFGRIERAIVVPDERGRPTGDGIVEFERKVSAQNAMSRINEGVFLLAASPRPITVEALEQRDEEDGITEKSLMKSASFHREREAKPRFAAPGAFELEFGNRWKQLYELEKTQRDNLEKNIKDAREKLEMEMDQAWHDHQTMLMRQDLMRRQEELARMEEARAQEQVRRREMEMRRQEEDRLREEERARNELLIRQRQEEIMRRRSNIGGPGGMGVESGIGSGYGGSSFGIPPGNSMGGQDLSGSAGGIGGRDPGYDSPVSASNTPVGMSGNMMGDSAGMGRDMGSRGMSSRDDRRGDIGSLRGPPPLPRLGDRRNRDEYGGVGDVKRRRY